MAVPDNAKLSDVQAEFGAPVGATLSEFYRDGTYVPDIPLNSGVPVDGLLKLSDLDGATDYVPMVLTLSADTTPNGSCSATNDSCTAVTSAVTCTVAEGVGPYTFLTEKSTGDVFLPVLNASSETSASFTYTSTNSNETVTYSAQYRIRVVDANGTIAYSDYFTVTNAHTFVADAPLVLEGATLIDSLFLPGSLAADGSGTGNYTITGGGTDIPNIELVQGVGFMQSVDITVTNVTSTGFKIEIFGTSGMGVYPWSAYWEMTVKVSRGGQTDSMVTDIRSRGGI